MGWYMGKKKSTPFWNIRKMLLLLTAFPSLYAMTGWRIGYLMLRTNTCGRWQTLHQNFFISANSFVQWAALTHAGKPGWSGTDEKYIWAARGAAGWLKKTGIWHCGWGQQCVLYSCQCKSVSALIRCSSAYDIWGGGVGCTPGIDLARMLKGPCALLCKSKENIREALERMKVYLESKEK